MRRDEEGLDWRDRGRWPNEKGDVMGREGGREGGQGRRAPVEQGQVHLLVNVLELRLHHNHALALGGVPDVL